MERDHFVSIARTTLIGLLAFAIAAGLSSAVFAADGDLLWPETDAGCEVIASDWDGGAISVYTSGGIYAERINNQGNAVWNPVEVASYSMDPRSPAIASDEVGGAIVTWRRQSPNHQIMAQRVSASGMILWPAPVQVSQSAYQLYPSIVPDGSSGAFILFGSRIAHIDRDGNLLGPGQGGIDLGPGQSYRMAYDGDGGAYVTWENYYDDIVAQRVDSNLNRPWGATPKTISVDSRNDAWPRVASDDSGGALITWHAYYIYPASAQVRVQRINSSGTTLWTANGVVVVDSTAVGGSQDAWMQYSVLPVVAPDGGGGAIVAWMDWRNDPTGAGNSDIYAQRVNSSGTPVWTANGIQTVIYAPGTQALPEIVSDKRGGAVVTFQDKGGWSYDISAIRISGDGTMPWKRYIYTDYPANPGTDEKMPWIFYDSSGPEPTGAIIGWDPHGCQKVQIGDGKQKVLHVSPTGQDTNDGSTWATSKKTIQAAVNAASPFTQIWVKGSTSTPYNERVTLKNAVQLFGGFMGTEMQLNERPPFPRSSSDPFQSIIDGGSSGSVITVPLPASGSTVIDGFTVRNGSATYGGGILCVGSSPTIHYNIIKSNSATEGGAIYCEHCSPTIADNVITQNTATNRGGGIHCHDKVTALISWNLITSNTTSTGDGGGIFDDSSDCRILYNTISGNVAGLAGGGVRFYLSNNPTLANNVIALNTAQYGGGVHYHYSHGVAVSNTVTGNIATVFGGGIDCHESQPVIANNIVAFNTGGIYGFGALPSLSHNDIFENLNYQYSGLSAGTGDIAADPLFVDFWAQNFHLTYQSPCINTGSNSSPYVPDTDIDRQVRVAQGTIDIGADESSSVAPQVTTLVNAKKAANGTTVYLLGLPVTGAFSGFLYIEEDDRFCGIRVNKDGHMLEVGRRVRVQGVVRTNDEGERFIDAAWVADSEAGSVGPLALPLRSLGGGNWFYNSSTGGGQRGVYMGTGLNNIGLLVRVTGRIQSATSDGFYIKDGTMSGGSGAQMTVKVLCPAGIVLPTPDSVVSVTGISSCRPFETNVVRMIRVRGQSDIQPR